MADYFGQTAFATRLDWGVDGVRRAAARGDAIVIVDVLSFSTSAVIAVDRNNQLIPCDYQTDAPALALRHHALLAGKRGAAISLSPASMLNAPADSRIVLPSPNGAACCVAAAGAPVVMLGALVNAGAAAAALPKGPVTLIAAGERWPDGSMRFAVEDLIGAGAVISHLPGPHSPEAQAALAAFEQATDVHATLKACGSGTELIERGFAQDVAIAARVDAYSCVPLLKDGVIRRAC